MAARLQHVYLQASTPSAPIPAIRGRWPTVSPPVIAGERPLRAMHPVAADGRDACHATEQRQCHRVPLPSTCRSNFARPAIIVSTNPQPPRVDSEIEDTQMHSAFLKIVSQQQHLGSGPAEAADLGDGDGLATVSDATSESNSGRSSMPMPVHDPSVIPACCNASTCPCSI